MQPRPPEFLIPNSSFLIRFLRRIVQFENKTAASPEAAVLGFRLASAGFDQNDVLQQIHAFDPSGHLLADAHQVREQDAVVLGGDVLHAGEDQLLLAVDELIGVGKAHDKSPFCR